ncbi:hypothetical protein PENSPDRAFT_564190, partial [Peniophora sp. CONT]
INDDHPLALELSSLRQAVHRFQHEAHSSALKLQRHSLESTLALERAHALERENAQIREELAVLRSHPDITPSSAALQVPELTLALRRLNDKLTATEDTLLARTNELARALADISKGKLEVEKAYALAAHTRALQEEGMARERELKRRVRAIEEERDMSDRVVREYASLVRSLERKQAPTSPPAEANGHGRSLSIASNLSEVLQDGRGSVHKLVTEFTAESEALEAEIVRLHAQLEVVERERDVERKVADFDRTELSRARTELDKLKIDDTTAAKMVSRYMKFSQSTTDTLQTAIDNLKARHAATLATRDQQLAALQASETSQQRQLDRLRDALDELTEQLARESYGRRREIALRLAVVAREDGLSEAVRRWARRARETYERADIEDSGPDALRDGFINIVDDAEQLIALVNGDDEVSRPEGEAGLGGVARILAAQDAVKTLVEELQNETEKRMRLERMLSRADIDENGEVVLAPLATTVGDLQRPLPDTPLETPASMGIKSPAGSAPVQSTSPLNASHVAPSASHNSIPPSEKRPVPLQLDNVTRTFPSISTPSTALHHPSPRVLQNPPAFMVDPATPTSATSATSEASVQTSCVGGDAATNLATTQTPPSPDNQSPNESSPLTTPPPALDPFTSPPSAQALSTDVLSDTSRNTEPIPADPLLAALSATATRYNSIQRALRDCHLTLKDVASILASMPTSQARSLLQAAAARLDDFGEDARVELEIRVADEERMARGFVTLLSVRGALTSPSDAAEAEKAARAFVNGTDVSVSRQQTRFDKKLTDLQHDVAALKRAVHDLAASPTPPVPSTPPPPEENGDRSWSSLAAGLFTPSRSSSPAPPSFGAIMTTPRLRRPPSSPRLGATATISNANTSANPFTAMGLDLRVPMPEHVPGLPARASPAPRQRTTSGMYMLGLG